MTFPGPLDVKKTREKKKKEAKVGRGAQLSQVVDDSPGGADENSLTVPIFHPSTVL
jgi:hypothetical protein